MNLSEELKREIRKYEGKSYMIRDKKERYNIKEIVKYVMYCDNIIIRNKNKVGITGGSIMMDENIQMGYGQLEQVSFGMSLDPKVPLDSFILNVIEFMDMNQFGEEKINMVKKFIDDYNIFMTPMEYKSPIYLAIGYLCVISVKPITRSDNDILVGVTEQGQFDELVEYSDDGMSEEEGEEGDFGDEFGEDEDW
jgi:hypothetical protein